MQYLTVAEAKHKPGLRLVLTAGVPGPWSEAAKALFYHHNVEYTPVRQDGGGDNLELLAWTKHRNAPVAIYNDEAPRVRWLELIDLAERLGHGISLVPAERDLRMAMFGLINEIAGESGFGWNARLLILDARYQSAGDDLYANPMAKDYRYEPEKAEKTKAEINRFLSFLSEQLKTQPGRYLIGDRFTAADLYWAYFSNLLNPQDHEINPMPDYLRRTYEVPGSVLDSYDPILMEHRDYIFEQHLLTPLDY